MSRKWKHAEFIADDGERAFAVMPDDTQPGERCTPICLISPLNKVNDADIIHANLIVAAPDLLYALKSLTKEIDLSKLNIRNDFSLINAHAYALQMIRKAEAGGENP